jgi:trehalose-6-phosphate synthase
MADAIQRALTMPRHERRKRMSALRKVVRQNNIYGWAADVVQNLIEAGTADEEWAPEEALAGFSAG